MPEKQDKFFNESTDLLWEGTELKTSREGGQGTNVLKTKG